MESFDHFSHEHQLELIRSPPKENISCSGCNLKILSDKDFYSCKECPFFLHQVCYNMPRRTQHPAHPSHYLTLHPKPSPSSKTLQCRACGGHVNGFHYTCADCEIYYHTLCLALPLSISVSSHTHNLKLTFSAPYDFCCDICNKPCNKIGWLYRCQFCEYDTHLSCAIYDRKGRVSNLQHQITPFPNSTTTSTTRLQSSSYLSTTLKGIIRSVDYTSEVNELMESVMLGHYLQLVGPSPSSTTTIPEDLSTTQSYQFSEACFSIDLDRSYSNYGHHRTNLAKRQPNSIDQVSKGTTVMPNMIILSNSKQNKQPPTAYAPHIGPAEDHRLKQSYLIRSPGSLPFMEALDQEQKEKKIKATSHLNKDNATKSDQDMSKRSSWQNLLSCILAGCEKKHYG